MFAIELPPYRLSGTVYGVLANDPATLLALGDAVHQAPYKAPPKYPALYIKPRNTLVQTGAVVHLPQGQTALSLGVTLGLVLARPACGVLPEQALSSVAGVCLVADISVPHQDLYRPNVKFKALDHSCIIGQTLLPVRDWLDIAQIQISYHVDDQPATVFTLAAMLRPAHQLLREVSDFMTLAAGDVLLLGLPHQAPLLRAGQSFTVSAAGLGTLQGSVV